MTSSLLSLGVVQYKFWCGLNSSVSDSVRASSSAIILRSGGAGCSSHESWPIAPDRELCHFCTEIRGCCGHEPHKPCMLLHKHSNLTHYLSVRPTGSSSRFDSRDSFEESGRLDVHGTHNRVAVRRRTLGTFPRRLAVDYGAQVSRQ